jgi:peptide/nickel transport system ATP-binding protein
MNALLEIRGLTIDIDRDSGPARVVDGIDLSVAEGESLGIVGESGCGKSLTMLSLVGLLPNRIRATGGVAQNSRARTFWPCRRRTCAACAARRSVSSSRTR